MSVSKCAPCGRVFTSVSGFDAHQERDYGGPAPVVCHDPATRGLVQDEQTGRWRLPGNAARGPWVTKMRASEAFPSVSGYPPDSEASSGASP